MHNASFKVFKTTPPFVTHRNAQTYDLTALRNAGAFDPPPSPHQERENTYISKIARNVKSKVMNKATT